MVEESRMMTLCLNSKDSISSREAGVCVLYSCHLYHSVLFSFLGGGAGGVVWGNNMKNLLLSIGDNQGDNLILVLDLSRIVGMCLLPTGFSRSMLLHSCLGDQRKP
jgi:hypothetical protein